MTLSQDMKMTEKKNVGSTMETCGLVDLSTRERSTPERKRCHQGDNYCFNRPGKIEQEKAQSWFEDTPTKHRQLLTYQKNIITLFLHTIGDPLVLLT